MKGEARTVDGEIRDLGDASQPYKPFRYMLARSVDIGLWLLWRGAGMAGDQLYRGLDLIFYV